MIRTRDLEAFSLAVLARSVMAYTVTWDFSFHQLRFQVYKYPSDIKFSDEKETLPLKNSINKGTI